MSADEGHYVDEFTVLKEIALNIGKVLMYILAGIVVIFTSIKWVFVLSALAALAFTLFRARDLRVSDKKISPVRSPVRTPF